MTSGGGADAQLETDINTWAAILANKMTMAEASEAGSVQMDGDQKGIETLLGCFDHKGLGFA